MNPIVFSSAEKQLCLSSYTQSIIIKECAIFINNLQIKANWTGNLNYWTGGFQECRGRMGSCAGENFVPIAENLTWAPNQPNLLKEGANCLHMRIHKNASSTALSARNCSDKFIYACEVSLLIVQERERIRFVCFILGKC